MHARGRRALGEIAVVAVITMQVEIIRGQAPTGYGDGYGSGDGSGDGSGSGYGDGSGSGYGDGYGSGYGDGSGDGSGSGYGDGYGSGYGDGSGDGDGDGDGDGYGSGYGDGYGSGYGSGDGDGYGSGPYWQATIECFAARLGGAFVDRVNELRASGAKIAFWRSDKSGKPANGGRANAVYPGLVQEEPGPLKNECGPGQLHATLLPPKWRGERWWIVALIGEVRGDDEKYWALKREIIGECL
jgi:hypothetical protein